MGNSRCVSFSIWQGEEDGELIDVGWVGDDYDESDMFKTN